MAEEKTVIIEVEVESKKLEKAEKLLESNKRARQALDKEIKKSNVVTDEQIKKRVKLQQTQKKLTATRNESIKKVQAEAGSLNALRLQLSKNVKERNNINRTTVEGSKRFEELNKEILANTQSLKGAEQAGGDFRRNVGNYSGELQNAIPGFAAGKAGIVTMTTAARAFIATPLGLVIAAVALGLAALKAAFTGSEEGQNKFAKITAVIGVLLGNLQDLLADLGEAIIEVFENPQKALEDFGNLIKDNLVTRFEGLVTLIPSLGKAIQALFAGKFAEAGKIAADAVGKVTLGVESITDTFTEATEAVGKFIEEQEKEVGLAQKVADARADADKLERTLLVDRAVLESEIAQLRLKSRQEEEFSAEERKQALIEAQELQDELLVREKEVLELRRFAQVEENKFSRSAKENLDAEAEATAAVSRIEAQRTSQQITTQRELNRLNKEIEGDTLKREKAASAAAKAREDAIDAEIEANVKLRLFRKEQDAINEEDDAIRLEKFIALEEAKRAAILNTQQLGEDERLLVIAQSEAAIKGLREKAAKNELGITKTKLSAEKKLAQDVFSTSLTLLGESSTAGKAVASIQAGINVAQGITKAIAQGGIAGLATGAIVAVQGAIQVAKINAAPAGAAALTGGGGTSGGSVASPSGGGLASVNASLLSQFSTQPSAANDNATATGQAVAENAPQAVVSVVEITDAQTNLDVKVNEATLG